MASLGTSRVAQIWAPWHDKITNFHLISDYFQPALGSVHFHTRRTRLSSYVWCDA